MITLTIKRTDGTLYWTEYFNDQASCDKWLAVEQTRPYWDKTYIATSVASAPPVIVDDSAVKTKHVVAAQALAAFDKTKFKAADVADLIDAIATLLGAK